ncbi:hypothetical protein BpHYR1_014227 [Brachionus plicatilis]|uniref:Uncharacterized protein n=1 Tax=Brachionus plicatilis TaxID=10195 RepID=A0A3M7SC46_BRAPC|nr:hypothetical protein BpHYR1_014227 [Brachionus plicatilis]
MNQPLSKESILEDRENEPLNDADEYCYDVIKPANQFKKREMVQEVKGGKTNGNCWFLKGKDGEKYSYYCAKKTAKSLQHQPSDLVSDEELGIEDDVPSPSKQACVLLTTSSKYQASNFN